LNPATDDDLYTQIETYEEEKIADLKEREERYQALAVNRSYGFFLFLFYLI
jgi:hypothetical protein